MAERKSSLLSIDRTPDNESMSQREIGPCTCGFEVAMLAAFGSAPSTDGNAAAAAAVPASALLTTRRRLADGGSPLAAVAAAAVLTLEDGAFAMEEDGGGGSKTSRSHCGGCRVRLLWTEAVAAAVAAAWLAEAPCMML
jgi:hypothetical protein